MGLGTTLVETTLHSLLRPKNQNTVLSDSACILQGYLVLISTRMSEIGEEQFSGRFFNGGMTDVSYSPELRHAVAAGPTSIKVGHLRRTLL